MTRELTFYERRAVSMHQEYQYLTLLDDCLRRGTYREGRNGGTSGVFGRQIRFDLAEGFPLLTTKRVPWKPVVAELLWFISGSTNIRPLLEQGVSIWSDWPLARYRAEAGDPEISQDAFERRIVEDEDFAATWGDLGPVYGKQWRQWSVRSSMGTEWHIDQLANVIEGLRLDPYGRRHVISAWNPGELDWMALPPCHCLFQFFVADGRLSCQLYQRSADVFLGVPFNIASYALLTHIVAAEAGLDVGEFVHTFGDLHLYANHVDQAREQLMREPQPLPRLAPFHAAGIDGYTRDAFHLLNYEPHARIEAAVSV